MMISNDNPNRAPETANTTSALRARSEALLVVAALTNGREESADEHFEAMLNHWKASGFAWGVVFQKNNATDGPYECGLLASRRDADSLYYAVLAMAAHDADKSLAAASAPK